MAIPQVTVLMCVYNGSPFLKEAIESILNQTFNDFEFLIINDCSTDNSLQIIKSYNDPRIYLVENQKNIGLTQSLNRGLELAKGKYIARMDADDISLPHRLSVQVAFMDLNIEIGVCGSWVQFIGTDDIIMFPLENEAIKICMFGSNAFAHSTVIIRNSLFKIFSLLYDAAHKFAQDYEIWSRAYRCFKLANIPEVLLLYRNHPNQVTEQNSIQQHKFRDITRLNQLKYLGIEPTQEEAGLHLAILSNESLSTIEHVKRSQDWFLRLKSANKKTKVYDNDLFEQMVKNLRINSMRNFYIQKKYTIALLSRFFHSSVKIYTFFTLMEQIKFTIKCLIMWKAKV